MSSVAKGDAFLAQRYQHVRSGFTLFVDNIHPEVYNVDLRRIFKRHGTVTDVYISRKKRHKTWKLFGFVRFERGKEAEEAIRLLNGWRLKEQKLYVNKAKFARDEKAKEAMKQRYRRKEADRPRVEASAPKTVPYLEQKEVANNEATDSRMRVVEGTVCAENAEWLKRSLVVDLVKHKPLDEVKDAVLQMWPSVSEVRDIGGFRFLVSFDEESEMEASLTKGAVDSLLNIEAISRWHEGISCLSRRVWIEIFGIPIHLWSKENMRSITAKVGKLLCLDESTENMSSLESAKVLMNTKFMPFIEDHLVLKGGGKEFELFLKEIDRPVHYSYEMSNSKVANSAMEELRSSGVNVHGKHMKNGRDDDDVSKNALIGGNLNDIDVTEVEEVVEESILNAHAEPLTHMTADDVSHLPIPLGPDQLAVAQTWNGEYEEMVGQSTRVADVSYNLQQEQELIEVFKGVVDGPPGFSNGPIVSVIENLDECPTNQAQPLKKCGSKTPNHTSGKRGRPRKSSRGATRLSKKQIKEIEKESSSDDEISNDEEEAIKTWAIAEKLNLVSSNKEAAIQAFSNLRRSSRGKDKECNTAR